MAGSRPHLVRDNEPDPPDVVQARVAALFQAHYVGLCSFVSRYLKSQEVAEEVVQELFLRLWERLTSGNAPDVEGITRSYLFAAARNRALNVLKRERLERTYTESAMRVEAPERTVHDDVEHRELAQAARRAIAALPERCRLVFDLSRRQGLTYAEIAAVLGVSVKAVEASMTRAIKALRVSLDRVTVVALTASIQAFLHRF